MEVYFFSAIAILFSLFSVVMYYIDKQTKKIKNLEYKLSELEKKLA